MVKAESNTQGSGVLAIILLAFSYGITAVTARYLSSGLGLFEQWYLRYGLAALIALLLFRNKINFAKLVHLPKRDYAVLIFRVFIGSVVAVGLYTKAAQEAKIGPVAFMQVIPTTALFGMLLFREKLTKAQAGFLMLAFFGAAVVVLNNAHDLAAFNIGEVWSLISGALFSLVLVTRKWHSNAANNYELTFAITSLAFVMNYILSIFLYKRLFIPSSHWTPGFALVLGAAAILGVAINFLSSYGFEHVKAVVASVILDLEIVFGALSGYIFYKETLQTREIIGGLIILIAVVLMSYSTKQEQVPPPTTN